MTAIDGHTLFDPMFAQDADPWHFEGSWYEERKRKILLSCLPHRRYASVFEPGCAGGYLSEHLAQRADRLLVWDGSARAVEYAEDRLRDHPHCRAAQGWIPNQWPEENFDLIVLSELLYYLPEQDIKAIAQRCHANARPGVETTVLACHWLRPFHNFPMGGAIAHATLNAHLQMTRVAQWADSDFCLDVWSTDLQTVAQREGRAD